MDPCTKLPPLNRTGIDKIPSSALIDARSVICDPLCSIINSSITSSTFPTAWKCASVFPLHKSGVRTTPSNYRPISLLPVASKILERHVQQQLSSHLNQNDLLFPFQSGFRQNHSTQSLLLYCLDQWYKALDDKKYVGVVFLDISKAFDTVNHNLLLLKLSHLGLSPSTIAWFKSYLSNRCHQTRIENTYSSLCFPTNGVPQGSTLGPTLFSAFINDLPSVLPSNSTVLFADDTTIFLISNDIQELNSSLQLTLNLANVWLQKNGLKLNISKTKTMLIHSARKKVSDRLALSVENVDIEQVQKFKFLGVIVNDTLSWGDHIDFVCNKVTRSLSLLRRLSWFLPRPLLLLYLKSYILPLFDYCDSVWSVCTKQDSHRLETLLNFACRTVLRKRRDYSASSARKELGVSTLSARQKVHLAQTVYKCLSLQSPTYLNNLFSTPASHYNTRASSTSQLNLPRFRTSLGQKAFSFVGASLWRSLPNNIRCCADFRVFTKLCENHFLNE